MTTPTVLGMTELDPCLLLHLLDPMIGDPTWQIVLRWVVVAAIWVTLGLGCLVTQEMVVGVYRRSLSFVSRRRRRRSIPGPGRAGTRRSTTSGTAWGASAAL